MDENPNNHKQPWLLYGWLAIIVFSVVLILATLPRMRQALHESQMVPLVSSYLEQSKSQENQKSEILLRLPKPQEQSEGFTYTTYPVPTVKNPTRHEIVEALLRGPTYEAFSEGAISLIPTGTRLIGLTVSNGIVFIDLSREFLMETPWEKDSHDLKIGQVRENLLSDPEIRDIVLLVEGKPIRDLIEKTQ